MKYLFLLYADETAFPAPGSPEMQATLDAYGVPPDTERTKYYRLVWDLGP